MRSIKNRKETVNSMLSVIDEQMETSDDAPELEDFVLGEFDHGDLEIIRRFVGSFAA